jgi:hypothetical protein
MVRPLVLAATLVALPIWGCAGGAATQENSRGAAPRSASGAAAVATTSIDRLTAVAKRRYSKEARGAEVRATLHRVASDPVVRGALESGDMARLRSYVRGRFGRVWYHWHVSRLRILRGSRMVVDVGVPFVIAPSQLALRDAHGRSLGTLQVSIQDVVGFVRFMHRNYPVDVVVRGWGAAHVKTSLAAARDARLPDSGTATVAGHRYRVRSFGGIALGGEPVKVWILQRG